MMWHVIKLDLMGIRRNNLLPITLSIFLTLPIFNARPCLWSVL